MKSGSKDSNTTVSKERMQMDAIALANIECAYKLSLLKLEDNRNDFNLQSQFNTVRQDITALSKIINKRYNQTKGLRDELNNMVKRFKEDLTTCQQLQEYENIRAEKNVEEPDTDKNNTKDKK
jgi:hypothetical protein|tara:strand:- start:220 stop:588 length:369 start_codon:yes stop_codon:yes gene_type:complete